MATVDTSELDVLDPALRLQFVSGLCLVERDRSTLQIGTDPPFCTVVHNAPPGAAELLRALDGNRSTHQVLLALADRYRIDPRSWTALLAALVSGGFLIAVSTEAADDGASAGPVAGGDAASGGMTGRNAVARGQAGRGVAEKSVTEAPFVQAERQTLLIRFGSDAAGQAMRNRREAVVQIAGSGRIAASMASMLAGAGVGHIHIEPGRQLRPVDICAAGVGHAWLTSGSGDPEDSAAVGTIPAAATATADASPGGDVAPPPAAHLPDTTTSDGAAAAPHPEIGSSESEPTASESAGQELKPREPIDSPPTEQKLRQSEPILIEPPEPGIPAPGIPEREPSERGQPPVRKRVRRPRTAAGPRTTGRTKSDADPRQSRLVSDRRALAAVIQRVAPQVSVHPPAGYVPPNVVVLAGDGAVDTAAVADLHRRGIPHLAVQAGDLSAVVGPFVVPGRTSCINCSNLYRTDQDPGWPLVLLALSKHHPGAPSTHAASVAATGAAQVLDFLDGLRPPDTLDGTLEWNSDSWQIRRRSWQKHPSCDCWR